MTYFKFMLVLLDIGNTSVTYGVYSGGRIIFQSNIDHNRFPKKLSNCIKSGINSHDVTLIVSSVVPQMTIKTIKIARKYKELTIWIVGRDIEVKIKHKYRNINKLGIDRRVNIYGALRIYKPPMLILDYGTALTADYVSPKGVFEGGMIIPGPEIAFQALLQRAALIPKSFRLPTSRRSFLGQTTYDCIRSGILEGYGAMTDGLINRFKSRYGNRLRVLSTGGFLQHLKPYIKEAVTHDPSLSLKSLLLLYKSSRRKN